MDLGCWIFGLGEVWRALVDLVDFDGLWWTLVDLVGLAY